MNRPETAHANAPLRNCMEFCRCTRSTAAAVRNRNGDDRRWVVDHEGQIAGPPLSLDDLAAQDWCLHIPDKGWMSPNDPPESAYVIRIAIYPDSEGECRIMMYHASGHVEQLRPRRIIVEKAITNAVEALADKITGRLQAMS